MAFCIHSLWMYTMNRCFHGAFSRLTALHPLASMALAGTLLFGLPMPAPAQTATVLPVRTLPIPATATLGTLQVLGWPEALLNGQPARMAPGSRIRDPNSLILPPASLSGNTYQVLYVLDPQGLIREAWLLTSNEVAALAPSVPVLNSP